MNDKRVTVGIIAITAVIIIGGAFLATKSEGQEQVLSSEQVEVSTGVTSHDWGEIGIDNGVVSANFEIKNEGSDNLRLSNIETSCMCTTAQLILGDAKSPLFGMHSKSAYYLEVPPGETANLSVVFDPAFHGPSGVGPITRQVKVLTNDSDEPELNFLLTAKVIK